MQCFSNFFPSVFPKSLTKHNPRLHVSTSLDFIFPESEHSSKEGHVWCAEIIQSVNKSHHILKIRSNQCLHIYKRPPSVFWLQPFGVTCLLSLSAPKMKTRSVLVTFAAVLLRGGDRSVGLTLQLLEGENTGRMYAPKLLLALLCAHSRHFTKCSG